jgi:hypothetical protein
MTSVNSKVVFITGGAHGIGAEVARRLHAKGAKLVLTDLDAAALADRSAELGGDDQVLTLVADVRDLAAMQAAAEAAAQKVRRYRRCGRQRRDRQLRHGGEGRPRGGQAGVGRQLAGCLSHRACRVAIGNRALRLRVDSFPHLDAYTAAPGMAPYDISKAGNEHLAHALRLEGRAPRCHRRFGTHVLDRHRVGLRHPVRPAHIPRAIGQNSVGR